MAEPSYEQLPPALYDDISPVIGESARFRLLAFKERHSSDSQPSLSCGALDSQSSFWSGTSENREEIELSMQTFSVDDCPPYIALSYTWEPRLPLQNIKLNEHDFQVGTNLHHFLRTMVRGNTKAVFDTKAWLAFEAMAPKANRASRSSNAAHWSEVQRNEYINNRCLWKFFWIDQICINQEDLSERGHQVKLMAQVYSNAAFVLAWLGTGDSNDRTQVYQKVICDAQCRTIANNLYWSRLWIVQEIFLARQVLICTGALYTIWRKAAMFPSSFRGPQIPRHMNWLMKIRNYWMFKNTSKGKSLSFLIEAFQNQNCSDPRDSVFGLLSLVRDTRGQTCTRVIADYEKSAEQVYIDVLQAVQFEKRLQPEWRWAGFQAVLARGLRLANPDVLDFTQLARRPSPNSVLAQSLSGNRTGWTLKRKRSSETEEEWNIDSIIKELNLYHKLRREKGAFGRQ